MSPGSTRVLVLTNMYPPHHYGGYELSCRDVVDRWRQRGHDVEVLTTTMRVPGVDDPPDERANGVRRVLGWYWDEHVLTSPPPWRRLAQERSNQRQLRDALRRHRPDVVSVWNMGALSLSLLGPIVESQIPVVYVVCDDWLIYGPRLDAWTRMFRNRPRLARLAALLARVPTAVPDIRGGTFCFVSQTTLERAVEHSGRQLPDTTVVYSGIDTDDFPVVAPSTRPWRGRLLCVGRIDNRKGFDSAIRAVAHLDEPVSLDIVGKGDESHLAELHRLVEALGLEQQVTFSTADRAELAGVFRSADAFLFPSTWSEPFGLVPVEAMACGTPVVASGVGGSAEFLADGFNCVRFDAGDDRSLADAVRRLADDPALRDRVCEGGRATASELTVDRLADVLEDWHVAAAGRFRDGRPTDRRSPLEVAQRP
ncbi:MAG: glycosyltransferase family 4 protein [Acidimicrobiales bacterium]